MDLACSTGSGRVFHGSAAMRRKACFVTFIFAILVNNVIVRPTFAVLGYASSHFKSLGGYSLCCKLLKTTSIMSPH